MRMLDEEFGMKVINGCHSKSNIYGFILFSEANYNMVKVMRDADFIAALHVISGPNWPIFFVSPLKRKIEDFIGTGCRDTIGYALCVSQEPEYNQSALEFFQLRDSVQDLPCFVVFSVNPKNPDEIEQKTFKISGRTEDEVKQSIEQIVTTIADVERTVRNGSDKKLDDSYIYWEATASLERMEVGNLIRNGFRGFGTAASIVAAIGRLFV